MNIGDVIICYADRASPYGNQLMGIRRMTALQQFKDGKLPSHLAAWYAPFGGGARKLIDDSEINWETSGL